MEQAQLKGGHTGARLLSLTLSLCLSHSVFLSAGTFSGRLNPCNGKDGHWPCSAYIRPASKPSRRISGSLQTQSLGSFCLVPLESHAHPCGILLGHTYKVLMMYFRIYQELQLDFQHNLFLTKTFALKKVYRMACQDIQLSFPETLPFS